MKPHLFFLCELGCGLAEPVILEARVWFPVGDEMLLSALELAFLKPHLVFFLCELGCCLAEPVILEARVWFPVGDDMLSGMELAFLKPHLVFLCEFGCVWLNPSF